MVEQKAISPFRTEMTIIKMKGGGTRWKIRLRQASKEGEQEQEGTQSQVTAKGLFSGRPRTGILNLPQASNKQL